MFRLSSKGGLWAVVLFAMAVVGACLWSIRAPAVPKPEIAKHKSEAQFQTASESTNHPASVSARLENAQAAAEVTDEGFNEARLSLAECLDKTSADDRHRSFLDFLQRMKPEEAAGVHRMITSMAKSGRDFGFELEAFWRRWGVIDSRGAIDYASKEIKVSSAAGAFHKILYGWATVDPNSAQLWLAENESHPNLRGAFLGFCSGYAAVEPAAATRVALSAASGSDKALLREALGLIANRVLESSDARGVRAWFDSLPSDPSARAAASYRIYEISARESTDAAMQWVEKQAHTPWRDNSTIGNLAYRLAADDPASAMDFVLRLPPFKDGSYIGMKEAVRAWADRDSASLERWILATSDKAVLKQAVNEYSAVLKAQGKQLSPQLGQALLLSNAQ